MHDICGIDFGTSNSALSYFDKDGQAVLAKVEDEHITIPTALFYSPHATQPTIGRAAQKLYTNGEEGRFMRSLKRVLGTETMALKTKLFKRSTNFTTIIAEFVNTLKTRTESQTGQKTKVVMGRPVHFVDFDHEADRAAQNQLELIAKNCGFKEIAFQYEPIAAAFAHERHLKQEKLALVVDIGGGTSDFTIIRLSPDAKDKIERDNDILANDGVRIGGNEFDKDLSLSSTMPLLGFGSVYGDKALKTPKHLYHDLCEWSKINFLYTQATIKTLQDIHSLSPEPEKIERFITVIEDQLGHMLLDRNEKAKIDLTDTEETLINLGFIEANLAATATRAKFNEAISEHVDSIKNSMAECIKQADISADAVELVILTGGSTEIPYIQNAIKGVFPKAELSQENKLSSVALGLGYDAKRRFS